jgi:archaetidylinositol phosphate synthase
MLWMNRKYFKGFSEKIGDVFGKIPLTPNQWTILSLFLAAFVFYLIFLGYFFSAFLLFVFTISIDMIDGAVARKKKMVTKVGGYLDSITDRAIEFLIILGLFVTPYPTILLPMNVWLMILLFGSLMSTYTRAAAFEKGVYKDLKGGILEHTDRLVLFLLILIVSELSLVYASYLIVLMAVLSNVSALQRFVKAIKR